MYGREGGLRVEFEILKIHAEKRIRHFMMHVLRYCFLTTFVFNKSLKSTKFNEDKNKIIIKNKRDKEGKFKESIISKH